MEHEALISKSQQKVQTEAIADNGVSESDTSKERTSEAWHQASRSNSPSVYSNKFDTIQIYNPNLIQYSTKYLNQNLKIPRQLKDLLE